MNSLTSLVDTSPVPAGVDAAYDEAVCRPRVAPRKFSRVESIPPIKSGVKVPTILGNGALITFASNGGDVDMVFNFFAGQVRKFGGDGSQLLDLALLYLIKERREEAYRVQARALERQQLYRVLGTRGEEVPVRRRILALMAPGDFMNNAQLEFLLDGTDIGLDVLYIVPGKSLPAVLPEHDAVFCAINESTENIPILRRLSRLLPMWPRPVLNAPGKIAQLTRDGIASLFADARTVCAPPVRRVSRADLRGLVAGETLLDDFLPGADFPILARPVGSHCGKDLEKIDSPELLRDYLKYRERDEADYFLSSFVDYRGTDGIFRKYRVAMIDRKPYLCHLAPSEQWKIHYIHVGMAESAEKRAEEARAMETFDDDFALRHAAAFTELCDRIGLDYFGIDCSELPDGRLLLFEAETAMVIHAMDSPTLYPYKQGQMAKVFAAFREWIDRASVRAPGLAGI